MKGANASMGFESALPETIQFYDLGEVTLTPESEIKIEIIDRTAFLFRIYGIDENENFSLVINFDTGLNHSMYTELGNIMASQFATRMSGTSKKEEVYISPPKKIQIETIEAYSRGREGVSVRNYLHIHENHQIKIQVILIDNLKGGRTVHV